MLAWPAAAVVAAGRSGQAGWEVAKTCHLRSWWGRELGQFLLHLHCPWPQLAAGHEGRQQACLAWADCCSAWLPLAPLHEGKHERQIEQAAGHQWKHIVFDDNRMKLDRSKVDRLINGTCMANPVQRMAGIEQEALDVEYTHP